MKTKLVRDNIVKIMQAQGKLVEHYKANQKEYVSRLKEKIVEESLELLDSKNETEEMEEIADIFEVIDSFILAKNYDKKTIKEIQDKKRNERGGFKKQLIIKTQVQYNDCSFCNNLALHVRQFKKIYPKLSQHNPILFQSDNFFVTPDNYPITKNHVLIIPKKHITSFNEIMNQELREELDNILNKLKIFTNSQNFTLFEHGSGFMDTHVSDASIYHAHLHCIFGVKYSVKQAISTIIKNEIHLSKYTQSYVHTCTQKDFYKIVQQHCNDNLYLLLTNSNQEMILLPENALLSKIPSQFFRRVIAQELYSKDAFWDWQEKVSIHEKKYLFDRIEQLLKKR